MGHLIQGCRQCPVGTRVKAQWRLGRASPRWWEQRHAAGDGQHLDSVLRSLCEGAKYSKWGRRVSTHFQPQSAGSGHGVAGKPPRPCPGSAGVHTTGTGWPHVCLRGSLAAPALESLLSAAHVAGNSQWKQGVATPCLASDAARTGRVLRCVRAGFLAPECPAHTQPNSKESFCPRAHSPLQFLSSLARAKPAGQEQEKRPGALWQE